jgi:hypothetical protein
MSILKGPVEGGQGGRLGHSNMEHWVYTDEIKASSRRLRRINAKLEIAQGLVEHEQDANVEDYDDLSDEFSK